MSGFTCAQVDVIYGHASAWRQTYSILSDTFVEFFYFLWKNVVSSVFSACFVHDRSERHKSGGVMPSIIIYLKHTKKNRQGCVDPLACWNTRSFASDEKRRPTVGEAALLTIIQRGRSSCVTHGILYVRKAKEEEPMQRERRKTWETIELSNTQWLYKAVELSGRQWM